MVDDGSRAHEEFERRRLSRGLACMATCLVVCGAGVGFQGIMMIASSRAVTGDRLTMEDTAYAIAGGFAGGLVAGLLGVVPFNLVVLHRSLKRSAILLALSLVWSGLACGLWVAILVGHRDTINPAHSNTHLGLAIFVPPIVGLALGLILCVRYAPKTWTPFPASACQSCGYDRAGLRAVAECPECAAPASMRDA